MREQSRTELLEKDQLNKLIEQVVYIQKLYQILKLPRPFTTWSYENTVLLLQVFSQISLATTSYYIHVRKRYVTGTSGTAILRLGHVPKFCQKF